MGLGAFIFLAALAVISALGVILQRNPIHSLLSLVLTLLVIAVLFVGLGAVTVGILQAIVYAGAIMILFLFVIWLLNLQSQPRDTGNLALKFFGAVAASALVAELFAFLIRLPAPMQTRATAPPPGYGSVNGLADLLFSDYLIAFEVTSILLLASIVGAVALARRQPLTASTMARPELAQSPQMSSDPSVHVAGGS
jgi:NADH-quinone oxidoreductase subunit J